METLLWGKRWHNKMSKMKSSSCRPGSVPIIISGQGKMVCWLVGGKCVKGSCPRSTLINNRQSQSHPNINLGQYKQLFYQPKPSQTPLTEVQKSEILTFFEIGQVTLTPPRFHWRLPPMPMGLIFHGWYMDRLIWAKRRDLWLERWPSTFWGPELFLSLYWVKAKWSVGWSVANVSKEVVPDQLLSMIYSPRAIQTSIWANTNNLSINQNHPRHLWPKFKKSDILTFFEIGQVTLTPRGSIANLSVGLNH